MHQSHTRLAKLLHDGESLVPICASAVTAMLLSIIILTCLSSGCSSKAFKVKERASVSR